MILVTTMTVSYRKICDMQKKQQVLPSKVHSPCGLRISEKVHDPPMSMAIDIQKIWV